jgi:hypothetical protein
MARFGSLWVGNPMTKIQEVSLSSFIYHRHDLTLYVYDMAMQVPDGVQKAFAGDIMDESEIFLVQDTYAAFSDLFRYRMIKKTGLAWVDADTICLSPDWDSLGDTYACFENNVVVGGVLSLPQDSPALNYLIKKSTQFDKTKIKWTDVGPALVDKTFRSYDLMHNVQPMEVFCGIHWSEWKKLWDPKYIKEIKILEKTSKSISVYHSMTTRGKIDKNYIPPNSAMEYFYNKFVTNKQEIR